MCLCYLLLSVKSQRILGCVDEINFTLFSMKISTVLAKALWEASARLALPPAPEGQKQSSALRTCDWVTSLPIIPAPAPSLHDRPWHRRPLYAHFQKIMREPRKKKITSFTSRGLNSDPVGMSGNVCGRKQKFVTIKRSDGALGPLASGHFHLVAPFKTTRSYSLAWRRGRPRILAKV